MSDEREDVDWNIEQALKELRSAKAKLRPPFPKDIPTAILNIDMAMDSIKGIRRTLKRVDCF